MLTYQDCVELKEAGFPQGNAQWIYPDGSVCGIPADREDGDTTICYVPSLSELIEACGEEEWFNLHFYPGYQGENKWEAKQSNPEFDETLKPEDEEFVALGSSPEQAVARLWIALQGKK